MDQRAPTSERVDARAPREEARDGNSEPPEPTHSEARDRQRARDPRSDLAEADTKVERRASVRPSAFGVPRTSAPPPPLPPERSEILLTRRPAHSDTREVPRTREAPREPHERVLEAARLLDAVAPALRELADDAHDHEQRLRLPNQRARGVEHLVARAGSEPPAVNKAPVSSAAVPVEARSVRERDQVAPAAHAQSASAAPSRAPSEFGSRANPRAATHAPRTESARPIAAHGSAREHHDAGASQLDARASTFGSRAEPRASTFGSRAEPRASTFGSRAEPRASTTASARRPWLSVVVFAGMLALSVVPLLRYTESGEQTGAQGRRAEARKIVRPEHVASTLAPARAEDQGRATTAAQVSGDTAEEIAKLLSKGNRALETSSIREAERMFGHVIELSGDDPHAAYGLARIRLIQNNLSGAEGWIQLALQKRPRRASFHALYAEVLTRMGRLSEAREEQARANVSRDSDDP
jgi:hypothetical protein